MYKLVLYYLVGLVAAAIGLSMLGYLDYSPYAIAFNAGYLTIICWLTNKVFAYVYEAPVNYESLYITALILTLIVTPIKVPHDILFLTAVAGLAIASKFILAINKKHIFNPAAVAVALMAFGPGQTASWWVGSVYLLPFVVVGGLLLTRKIQRGSMVMSYLLAVVSSTIVISILTHHDAWANLQKSILHSALLFLAFVMLTEPMTSPATKVRQRWYGVLAGLLFPPQLHVFSVYSTPELSLIVANVFSYFVSPKSKLLPRLSQKLVTSPDTMDFVFAPGQRVDYKPGQYMEWTLPHHKPDARGTRRYFTLASSPTEDTLRLGVKFYPKGSSYKQAMLAMNNTSQVASGQLGGDFVLPDDPSQKLVFIAGGIGVTPFRSMIKYLVDTDDRRDVAMFYSAKNPQEFVYTDVFDVAAKAFGLKMIYTITDLNQGAVPDGWRGKTGFITADMMVDEVPDYMKRLFYISGSHSMVTAMQGMLRSLGVARHRIKTDYFPGYDSGTFRKAV